MTKSRGASIRWHEHGASDCECHAAAREQQLLLSSVLPATLPAPIIEMTRRFDGTSDRECHAAAREQHFLLSSVLPATLLAPIIEMARRFDGY